MNILVNATRHRTYFFPLLVSDKRKVHVNSIKFETAEKCRVARPSHATFLVAAEKRY